MVLIDLKNYLKTKQACSLQEISFHFQQDPQVTKDMLAHWIRKGVIETVDHCGTQCGKCPGEGVVIYRWIGNR